MENWILLLAAIAIIAAIMIRLALGSMDKTRIADYVHERGGRIMSISWAPFGKGWFGEKNSRIYEVVFYDSEGNQHFATCKTSLFSGVYWTEDRMTHRRAGWVAGLPKENEAGRPLIRAIPEVGEEDVQSENDRLRAENRQLKEELERLKRGD